MTGDAEEIELIPRSVRDKLDRVGIKLHLAEWQRFPLDERARLRDLPCAEAAEVEAYRRRVETLVIEVSGQPAERLAPRR